VVVANLDKSWKVQFDASQRGPEEPVTFDKLQDWAQFSDERIRYYSGTASYERAFSIDTMPAGKNFLLNLGNLTAMAKVYVNGKYAGGVWTPPYQLDISEFVTQGKNILRVDVVNTWVNRLIGDLNLPEEQRETWCTVNSYKADSPLQASGLFGPVNVTRVKY
jgi:hypothetical protein